MRVAALTAAAMLAFAANSLLCRMALADGQIDAASFTSIRVVSGAAALILITLLKQGRMPAMAANWPSVLALVVYLVFFAFAYISLGAATGVLILFGAVQLTMFGWALRSGERQAPLAWVGLTLALSGLIYLVLPGLAAPDPFGALLMAVAGVGWGAYSLLGRTTTNPLVATTTNFIWAAPPVLVFTLVLLASSHASPVGVAYAIVSGALASGCGYAIWYAALPGLTRTQAATVQLSVPVIAALGAVAVLAEPVTQRLFFSSIATLGGVAVALWQRAKKSPRHQRSAP